MSLYELLFIFFIGVAVLAWAVGAWAKRREDSAARPPRELSDNDRSK